MKNRLGGKRRKLNLKGQELNREEMVKAKFNPGGPVAIYESAESGISPLMVIPRNAQEIEEEIRQKL